MKFGKSSWSSGRSRASWSKVSNQSFWNPVMTAVPTMNYRHATYPVLLLTVFMVVVGGIASSASASNFPSDHHNNHNNGDLLLNGKDNDNQLELQPVVRSEGRNNNDNNGISKHLLNSVRRAHRTLKGRRHCYVFDDKEKDFTETEGANAEDQYHPNNDFYAEDEPAVTEIVCAKESQFCYAFWHFDGNGTRRFLKQGCWETSSQSECRNSSCVDLVKRPKSSGPTTVSPHKHLNQQEATINPEESNSDDEFDEDDPYQSHFQHQQNPHYFCCCDSDYCNMDVGVAYVDAPESDSEEELEDLEYSNPSGKRSLPIILISTGSVFCGVVILLVAYRYWRRMTLRYNKNGGAGGEAGEDGGEDGLSQLGMNEGKLLLGGEEENVDDRNIIDGIQLVVLLARGKFASVYEGKIPSLSDAPYALKCFTKDQKEFFENERFVFNYLGKHCNHENIIKYYGWQEFTVGPTTHLILVLDKICPGNLREYLQSITGAGDTTQEEGENENDSVLKIMDVLRISSGIASGLSYLHGENRDEIVIVHRDLTSKNILLDGETLTPKITDFGLSLVTRGSKYYWAGRERQAEFCSLAEAGTLRYMAPELLEGAVNLKDCENALKQADVYALALIIWEVANCSKDVRLTRQPSQQNQNQQTGEIGNGDETGHNANSGTSVILPVQHCLPYEEEIGKESFSMDLLTRHVVQYRNRPNFRRWRDTPYTRQVRDTLVESWDAEPDARLTALCIVERLMDIRNIRVKNSDLPGIGSTTQQQQQLQTPLESPTQNGLYGSDSAVIDSPWTGRNPCLQRNLLTVTAGSTTSGGGGGGGLGMSTGSGMSESNSLLEGHHHPLLLNHYDFAKNQANLNFYHNYVGGSSGGASYSSTSTTSASTGMGGNVTEMSNVSSVTDERSRPLAEIRFQNTGGAAGSVSTSQSPVGGSAQTGAPNVAGGGPPPLPPTIPFVQNLHA